MKEFGKHELFYSLYLFFECAAIQNAVDLFNQVRECKIKKKSHKSFAGISKVKCGLPWPCDCFTRHSLSFSWGSVNCLVYLSALIQNILVMKLFPPKVSVALVYKIILP